MIELLSELTPQLYETVLMQKVRPQLAAECLERLIEHEDEKKLYLARYGQIKERCGRLRSAVDTVSSDKGKKKVLLLTHGFTEGIEKYAEMIYYFRQLGYIVYALEQCGHGRSYRLTDDPSLVDVDDWKRYVRDLLFITKLILQECHVSKISVFAHSMGGAVTLAAAAGKPQWYDRLILSSPMLRALPKDKQWRMAQTAASVICLCGKGRHYLPGQQSYQPNETFENGHASSQSRFSAANQLKETQAYLQLSAGSVRWFKQCAGLWHFLQKKAVRLVEARVLLFQAGADSLVSNAKQQWWMETFRSSGRAGAEASRLVVIPDAKHEIYLGTDEMLQQYWREIEEFLEAE